MKNSKKRFFVSAICLTLLVTSLSVFAGYSAKGFGPTNNYYAELQAYSDEAIAWTSGTGSKTTTVYGYYQDSLGLSPVSARGSSVASVGNGSPGFAFVRAMSNHWCGNCSTNVYTNV